MLKNRLIILLLLLLKSFKLSEDFYDKGIMDKDIQPYSIKLENSLIVFECIGKKDDFYSVIVNKNNELIKYIKVSDPIYKFEKWEDHILHVFAIDFNHEGNLIREQPNDSSKEIPYDKDQFYHPVEVKGDWLMIKDDTEKKGWIRWKDKEGKIDIILYYEA